MTSSRSYLLRALHEWVLDNTMTPYVVVDATQPGVVVPQDFVSGGQIVLNISPSAVRDLLIGMECLEFGARFGGVPMRVVVPMAAVMAIYAKENGQGMVFGAEPGTPPQPPAADGGGGGGREAAAGGRPTLKVVK